MGDDSGTITVWPGIDGWDIIDDLDELANARGESRNQLILDAISLFIEVENELRDSKAWENANTHERRIMLRSALSNYRDDW